MHDPTRPDVNEARQAQTGERPPFPNGTARWHQGSAVVRSVLRLLDRAVEIRRGSAAGAFLTRYELGDGEGDNLGRTVDVGDHAARFRSGQATAIGAQA